MITIQEFENVNWKDKEGTKNINRSLYHAYTDTQEAGNETLNFGEVIWDDDVKGIVEKCRELGITEFTVSSAFSSLTATLWEMQQLGCTIAGMRMVPTRFTRYNPETGEREREQAPAIIVKL